MIYIQFLLRSIESANITFFFFNLQIEQYFFQVQHDVFYLFIYLFKFTLIN